MSNTGDAPLDLTTIAQPRELPPPPSDRAGLLAEVLAARVPCPPGSGAVPPSVGELLHDPNPSPDLLKHTKDFAKKNRNDPASPLLPEVATVLYYASIAVALARCGRRISRHDDRTLRQGFRWGCDQPWVDEATRELLRAGLRHLGDADEPAE